MSILLVIPVRDQINRLEPMIESLGLILKRDINDIVFSIEENPKETKSVINYLNQKYDLPQNQILEPKKRDRFLSFEASIQKSKEMDLDYIMIMNEGWEDNIHEFINFVKNKEFLKYNAIIGRRTPNEITLGAFYNQLSNIICSLILKKPILETKCDSINIYKVDAIPNLSLTSKRESTFFFEILKENIKNGEIKFSDVDFGLNYRSFIKLNTKRFFQLIFRLIFSKV